MGGLHAIKSNGQYPQSSPDPRQHVMHCLIAFPLNALSTVKLASSPTQPVSLVPQYPEAQPLPLVSSPTYTSPVYSTLTYQSSQFTYTSARQWKPNMPQSQLLNIPPSKHFRSHLHTFYRVMATASSPPSRPQLEEAVLIPLLISHTLHPIHQGLCLLLLLLTSTATTQVHCLSPRLCEQPPQWSLQCHP